MSQRVCVSVEACVYVVYMIIIGYGRLGLKSNPPLEVTHSNADTHTHKCHVLIIHK